MLCGWALGLGFLGGDGKVVILDGQMQGGGLFGAVRLYPPHDPPAAPAGHLCEPVPPGALAGAAMTPGS